MKSLLRKSILPLLFTPLLLTSCESGQSPYNEVKQAEEVPSDAADAELDEGEVWYPTVIESSPYGYVTPGAASAKAGAPITYVVTSYEPEYIPAGLEVNGEVFDLDENYSVSTTMAEGGLTVKPLFKADFSDFSISPNYRSITVEQIPNAEYRLQYTDHSGVEHDSGWQTSNIFDDGLIIRLDYTVSVRVKGDGDTLLDSDVFTKQTHTAPVSDIALDNILASDFALEGGFDMSLSQMGQAFGSAHVESAMALTSDFYTISLASSDSSISGATYYRGSYNSIVMKQINYLNQVSEATIDGVEFSSMFVNPFTQLTDDQTYTSADNSRLYFRIADLEMPQLFTTLLFSDASINMTELYVDLDADLQPVSLHLEGYYYDASVIGAKYEVVYDGDFVDADSVEKFDPKPYEHLPEHDRLAELFTALKEQNYTARISVVPTGAQTGIEDTLYVTPTSATTVSATGVTGMLQNDDGFYRFTAVEDDDTTVLEYPSGYPLSNVDLATYGPNWSFAPEVFEVTEDGRFHLINDINFYNYADFVLPDVFDQTNSMALYIDDGSLYIDIDKDADGNLTATFTYTYSVTDSETGEVSTGKATVEVDHIGATTDPYAGYELVQAAAE